MTYRLLIVIVLVSLLLAACGGASATPQPFISKAGKFMVTFPGLPTESIQNTPGELGDITTHLLSYSQGNKVYDVSYTDYPEEYTPSLDAEKIVKNARDSAVEKLNGSVDSEKQFSVDNSSGLEFMITARDPENQPVTLKARMFMVGNLFYQVWAMAPKDQANEAEMNRFLDSFKLIEIKQP
jgi:hypothetical protein